jgi:hypothetical protein
MDENGSLYRNGEQYADPTAGAAIKSAEPKKGDPEVERASDMVRQIKALLAKNGYRLIERVKFEDIYTGREWA